MALLRARQRSPGRRPRVDVPLPSDQPREGDAGTEGHARVEEGAEARRGDADQAHDGEVRRGQGEELRGRRPSGSDQREQARDGHDVEERQRPVADAEVAAVDRLGAAIQRGPQLEPVLHVQAHDPEDLGRVCAQVVERVPAELRVQVDFVGRVDPHHRVVRIEVRVDERVRLPRLVREGGVEVEAVRGDEDRPADLYCVAHDPRRDDHEHDRDEPDRVLPAEPPQHPARDHDDEPLRARPIEHQQSERDAGEHGPPVEQEEHRREQQQHRRRLDQHRHVVRDHGRVQRQHHPGAQPGPRSADALRDQRAQHGRRAPGGDVDALRDADVDAEDVEHGGDQRRVQRRAQCRRVDELERHVERVAVAPGHRSADRVVVLGVADRHVPADERDHVDDPRDQRRRGHEPEVPAARRQGRSALRRGRSGGRGHGGGRYLSRAAIRLVRCLRGAGAVGAACRLSRRYEWRARPDPAGSRRTCKRFARAGS